MTSTIESQQASAVLMIRPARFESNELTAESNRFQRQQDATPEQLQRAAVSEFESIGDVLEENGITVIRVDDTAEPHTPDSIFPNNWVSFHGDGTVVLYPMEAANRRTERRQDIVESLSRDHGFQVSEIIDLSLHENECHYLEGTGSMVLDRVNRVAYACLSSRTHLDVLGEFAQRMDYEIVAFDAVDKEGTAIYHTNVLMNVGESLAVICTDTISRSSQRQAVLQRLEESGHEVLTISHEQMEAFAGNMLELRSVNGERVIAMSSRARTSLTDEQLATIDEHGRVVDADIHTIEDSAGGSVRCMLAEIHLPQLR
jgi:hypothetical protein